MRSALSASEFGDEVPSKFSCVMAILVDLILYVCKGSSANTIFAVVVVDVDVVVTLIVVDSLASVALDSEGRICPVGLVFECDVELLFKLINF